MTGIDEGSGPTSISRHELISQTIGLSFSLVMRPLLAAATRKCTYMEVCHLLTSRSQSP